MLEATDLTVSTGECLLVAAEPGHGHTALALVATGRLAPSTGRVRLVLGEADDVRPAVRALLADPRRPTPAETLRGVSAVVDVPGVNEPDDALTVSDVVAEGLALAGRRSLPQDVTRWLGAHSLVAERRTRIDQLPGVVRTAVLAALAAERPGVRFLALTLPDRHGGEPDGWWEVARTLAASGLGVLVQCSRASARALGADLPPARGSLHEPPVVAPVTTSKEDR
nr:hypothetical protein [Cellulosimicrobium arenosum]